MGLERRGRAGQVTQTPTLLGEEPMGGPQPKVKSFEIDKRLVYVAWERVRANQGAPGVDTVSITDFAADERGNLFKLWNRMSSGSYVPGSVRAVELPRDHGTGIRVLGVPNVADRIAQTAAAMLLEDKLEPIFHPDSYGYRPGRSAHDALTVARKRCWQQDWIVDLDIRAFFDSVPHDLLLKAVAHHTDERWVLLYIARWLTAPCRCRTELWSLGRKGPHKGLRSPLCWPTCSCTMRSTGGWPGPSRVFRSSDTQMMVCHERNWSLRCRRSHRELRCCTGDGGRSSAAALQEEAANHRQLLR